MSKNVNGLIAWLRQWFDDIYALKGETGGANANVSGFDVNKVYPVGSIYMSVNNSDPSVLFGGHWMQIEDKFLIGASYGGFGLGSTGGEAYHTLTVSEMPSHTHTQNAHSHTPSSGRSFLTAPSGSGWVEIQGANISGSGYHYLATSDSSNYNVYTQASGSTTATNQNTGGGQGHNNLPPYLAVNIWKRVPYYYNASTINWNVTSVSNNIGRKCYKNIQAIPDSDYFTVECIANVASIGKWFSSGLCLTVGEPVDNTTTSSENYSKKVIVGFYSSDSYSNNAAIKGTGGVNLNKNTDYLLKFIIKDKYFISWQISDLNNNILSSGTLESDVSNYTHLSFHSFEGVNMSVREFNVY